LKKESIVFGSAVRKPPTPAISARLKWMDRTQTVVGACHAPGLRNPSKSRTAALRLATPGVALRLFDALRTPFQLHNALQDSPI
jgi:hypothetical protein